MKTWVRKTLSAGVLAAGALLLAPGAAHADVTQATSDNVGIANGTQVFTTVAVPLNVVGNSIGVAGESNAAGQGINWVESGKQGKGGKYKQHSWNNTGVLNGTQVLLPVTVPVNVVGNAASVLGVANAAGSGVNKTESARTEGAKVDQDSSDNTGVLNGTQVAAPINVPVNVCGNSLAILGLANSQAVCVNGGGHKTESVKQDSSDNTGIGNGTQIAAPVYVPLNITGNAASVLGEANAAGASANESGHQGGGIKQDSSGNTGVLNGTQVAAPINVPVNVCGNALAILGEANASAACSNGTGNGGNNGGDNGGDNGGYDDGDDVDGDGGSQGGDDSYGEHPRTHAASKTEATPVDGLTQNLSNAGGLNVGGLDVTGLLK
ncbi:chaplin [Couchioplanes caeruleus]|uniref:chaplin n=1 Tax=Couchioplanes caeruleus TaxID=56438 RepID=UPI0020BDBBA3|nr:chaplin [Couchioplanes caeruleus]UQU64943.1 chaplin [Couchioplanes caeruleus]